MAYSYSTSPEVLFHPFVLITTDVDIANPTTANCASETTLITQFDNNSIATEYVLLGKLEKPVTVNFENQTIETSDGDTIITAEQVNFSSNDLNFSSANYTELRTNLHKKKATILLVDPNRLNGSSEIEAIKLTNMPMIVTPDINEMTKMMITSTKQASNADDVFSIVTLD